MVRVQQHGVHALQDCEEFLSDTVVSYRFLRQDFQFIEVQRDEIPTPGRSIYRCFPCPRIRSENLWSNFSFLLPRTGVSLREPTTFCSLSIIYLAFPPSKTPLLSATVEHADSRLSLNDPSTYL